ncbi:RNA polymerase factor sigma-54 [Longispora urticae]
MDLALRPKVELRVRAEQVALATVLAMPATALVADIERELAGNPALESAPADRRTHAPGPDPDQLAAGSPGWETLFSEAAVLLPGSDRWIAGHLCADLDPRGWLGRTPAEAAAWLGVDVSRIHRALAAIRSVGPPGTGAADLADALLLHLDALPVRAPDLVRPVILGHLADVAAGRCDRIAAALDRPVADVRAAVDFLRHRLVPHAGPDPGTGPPAPPDVVVRFGPGGTLEVDVPAVGADLRINREYARLAAAPPAGLSPEECSAVRSQVAAAREFLARLTRRAGTLRRVAEHVVGRQAGFVRTGPAGHRPLSRADVARDLGLHETTVGRAVADKTVLLPAGRTEDFGAFFGGGTCARDLLARLVAAEDRPLTDGELAVELARHGHPVSRRTVAKYRGQLAIAPAPLR